MVFLFFALQSGGIIMAYPNSRLMKSQKTSQRCPSQQDQSQHHHCHHPHHHYWIPEVTQHHNKMTLAPFQQKRHTTRLYSIGPLTPWHSTTTTMTTPMSRALKAGMFWLE
jgi:hypothetical protein